MDDLELDDGPYIDKLKNYDSLHIHVSHSSVLVTTLAL